MSDSNINKDNEQQSAQATHPDDRGYISTRIRQRIRQAGARFHANDNIARFIEPGELELLQQEVEEKCRRCSPVW